MNNELRELYNRLINKTNFSHSYRFFAKNNLDNLFYIVFNNLY